MSIDDVYKKLREQPVELDEVQKRRVLTSVLNWRSWPRKSRAPWIIAAAAVIVAAAVAAVFVLDLPGLTQGDDRSSAPGDDQPPTLALAGLGRAVLQPGADVSIETKTDDLLEVAQSRGNVRYEVDRPQGHEVVIRAGGYAIKVVGTVFEVEVDDDELSVRVDEGVVQVEGGERVVKLVAGDEISMAVRGDSEEKPEIAVTDSMCEPAGQKHSAALDEGSTPGATTDPTSSEPGDGQGPTLENAPEGEAPPIAPEQPRAAEDGAASEPTISPAPTIEELLSEVDDARREGALAEASRLLDQIVQRYPNDPRSINALFTMGNVERQRGNHAKAAKAYDRCWRLKPSGLLAEDARAEAAASWSRAGRKDLATKTAKSYLELYPQGNHVERMKSLSE